MQHGKSRVVVLEDAREKQNPKAGGRRCPFEACGRVVVAVYGVFGSRSCYPVLTAQPALAVPWDAGSGCGTTGLLLALSDGLTWPWRKQTFQERATAALKLMRKR